MLACLLQTSSSKDVVIVTPPQNAVAVADSSVKLTCGIDQEYNNYMEWRAFFGNTMGGRQIYHSPPFTPTSPRFHQFEDFGLEINPVEWRDAGAYSCVFLMGDVRASASIVVVGRLKNNSFIYFSHY